MSQLILLALLWYSGNQGDFELHFFCGYLMLSLLCTRIIWGFIGSETSKFSHFIHSPFRVFKQLSTKNYQANTIGHHSLAGYMVLALILSLSVQVFTGLFATDDVLAEGPLLYYVSDELAESLDRIHDVNFDILLVLISLHVVGAIWHSAKIANVIKAIITGNINTNGQSKPPQLKPALLPLAIWLVLFSIMAYFGIYAIESY